VVGFVVIDVVEVVVRFEVVVEVYIELFPRIKKNLRTLKSSFALSRSTFDNPRGGGSIEPTIWFPIARRK
jgi:hypothetical protein